MLKKIFLTLIAIVILAACGAQNSISEDEAPPPGGKNPKTASVTVEDQVVTIKFPSHTPSHTSYFWLEKVNDDSVPYTHLYFRYDAEAAEFFFRTNLVDWQPVVMTEGGAVEMGLVKILFETKEITITYPSGTWAFP